MWPAPLLKRGLAIFEEGNSPIEMYAAGNAELVIGSAVKHPYALVCGPSSVHTSRETLQRGLSNIEALRPR